MQDLVPSITIYEIPMFRTESEIFNVYYILWFQGVRLCVAYILECYSLNEDFSTVSISTMTVAATHLALITLYPLCDGWNKNMFRHSLTECTTAKLQTAMLQTIYEIQKPESKFHALYKKYACVENHCVSTFFLKAVGVV